MDSSVVFTVLTFASLSASAVTVVLLLSGELVAHQSQTLRDRLYSPSARSFRLIRSRASSESFRGAASTISSGCSCAASRRKRSCFPYLRHHAHSSRCNRSPTRWRIGSLRSSAADWSREACLQLGESKAIPLARVFNTAFSQFISPSRSIQVPRRVPSRINDNTVPSRFVGGKQKSLRQFSLPAREGAGRNSSLNHDPTLNPNLPSRLRVLLRSSFSATITRLAAVAPCAVWLPLISCAPTERRRVR